MFMPDAIVPCALAWLPFASPGLDHDDLDVLRQRALVRAHAAEPDVLPRPGRAARRSPEFEFSAEDDLRHRALPQSFFQAATAYAVRWHAGVPLGKANDRGGRSGAVGL